MSSPQLAIQFFLQLAIILGVCQLAGSLVARIRQPRVVGEMIAGILLGPSLLGAIAPSLHAAVFPGVSLAVMSVVSQLGLALYMFVVGAELQTDFLRQAFRGALAISLTGIIVPFVLGAGLASFLLADARFFASGIADWQGMMYLGAAMSVTAFPVLARIIQERGIAGTAVGTLALAAGAADDVVAWCLLAFVLAGLSNNFGLAATAVIGAAVYVVAVLVFVRPLLASMTRRAEEHGRLNPPTLTLILALVMAGAWFTDMIGVHAVFGAFVMGVAIPRGVVAKELAKNIEPVASSLLVPLFFAYSGLSTHFNLLWSFDLLALALVVIVVASLGKGAACWAAARFAGRPNRDALAIGALMNARGLMELIILNIGLQRGLITPTLFTVMVSMTLVTTLVAGPVFEWAWRGSPEVPDAAGVAVR